MKVSTLVPEVGRARAAGDAVPHAQSPGGLRDLRQGGRMPPAGLRIRLRPAALALDGREASQAQAARPEPAHPARQRALHPLQPLRALHARDLEVEHARHRRARRARVRRARRSASPTTIRTRTTSSACARRARCCRATSSTRAACWFLEPVRSVCTGCSRGCSIDLWRRKKEWRHALARRGAQPHAVPRHRPREPRDQRSLALQQGLRPAQADDAGSGR